MCCFTTSPQLLNEWMNVDEIKFKNDQPLEEGVKDSHWHQRLERNVSVLNIFQKLFQLSRNQIKMKIKILRRENSGDVLGERYFEGCWLYIYFLFLPIGLKSQESKPRHINWPEEIFRLKSWSNRVLIGLSIRICSWILHLCDKID